MPSVIVDAAQCGLEGGIPADRRAAVEVVHLRRAVQAETELEVVLAAELRVSVGQQRAIRLEMVFKRDVRDLRLDAQDFAIEMNPRQKRFSAVPEDLDLALGAAANPAAVVLGAFDEDRLRCGEIHGQGTVSWYGPQRFIPGEPVAKGRSSFLFAFNDLGLEPTSSEREITHGCTETRILSHAILFLDVAFTDFLRIFILQNFQILC